LDLDHTVYRLGDAQADGVNYAGFLRERVFNRRFTVSSVQMGSYQVIGCAHMNTALLLPAKLNSGQGGHAVIASDETRYNIDAHPNQLK